MMNYRTVILPIISTVAIFIQLVFGIEIPDETINELAVTIGNLVLVVLTIYGIFKNHKK